MILFNHNKNYGEIIMEFKRVELDVGRNVLTNLIKTRRKRLPEIEFFEWLMNNQVLVIKIQKRTKSDKLGVPKGAGNSHSLNSVINDNQICELEFVVVFANLNTVYYTGNQKEVKTVIENFFDIGGVRFLTNISVEDLVELHKIVMTDNLPNQLSISSYGSDSVKKIVQLTDYTNLKKVKSEFTVNIRTTGIFREKIREFINEQPTGVSIGFHGIDKNGKKVICSANRSMLKVNVFGKELKHEERQKIEAIKIYESLLKAIGE